VCFGIVGSINADLLFVDPKKYFNLKQEHTKFKLAIKYSKIYYTEAKSVGFGFSKN